MKSIDEIASHMTGLLYPSVQPMAVGTTQTESLGSYLHRLACAHSVEALDLLQYILEEAGLKKVRNGISFYAQFRYEEQDTIQMLPWLTSVLEISTRRQDLQSLSLSKWTNVLSMNHIHREFMAWCPLCIQAWQTANQTVYEPLSWTFNMVTTCSIHRGRLISKCSQCGYQPKYFDRGLVLGYCPRCHVSLGESAVTTLVAEARHEHVIEAIHDLIVATRSMDSIPQTTCIPGAVNLYKNSFCKGNGSELSRKIGIEQTLLLDKYMSNHRVSLSTSVQLAEFFEVPVHKLLNGQFINEVNAMLASPRSNEPNEKRANETDWNKESVREWLHAALKAYPPQALGRVAEHMGFTRRRLSLNFPELCQQISDRYKDFCIRQKGYYPGSHLNAPTSSDTQLAIKNQLLDFLTKYPPYTVVEIANKVGKDKRVLQRDFPDLCDQLDKRYWEHKHEHQVYKGGKHKSYTRKELECLLNSKFQHEDVYCTQSIAKELGLKQRVLKTLFPDLYAQITDRYNASQAEINQRLRENRQANLKKIIIEIHQSGYYPSTTRVIKALGKNPYKDNQLTQIWRDTLIELGYEPN
jgi:hypothetical protein